jgi:hypothetical protein
MFMLRICSSTQTAQTNVLPTYLDSSFLLQSFRYAVLSGVRNLELLIEEAI